MPALSCLYGPAFDLVGEIYLPNNFFSFAVEFETPAGQQSVLAYQWFLDQIILIDEGAQEVDSRADSGPHTIGVRILTADGWSGVKYLDFYANIIANSFTIQGPVQVREGASASYETYLTFGSNAPVKVTDKTSFSINLGGNFDFNLLSTFRDNVNFYNRQATVTATLGSQFSKTYPITILSTNVRYPAVLVVDIFNDSILNAAAMIVNPDVTFAQVLTYTGHNFLPANTPVAGAFILASDLVNNGSSLKWRFEFNILKLIQQYPNIQDFVLEIRAKSNVARYINGAFGLKDYTAGMLMTGSAGSYIPTITSGNDVQYGSYRTFVAGGANGTFTQNALPMALRFNFNVASSKVTYIGSEQQFYSNLIAASIFKNDCPTGYVGSKVGYVLPQGAFTSSISQQDADSRAQNYFNGYKQQYANQNGTCFFRSAFDYIVIAPTSGSSIMIHGKLKLMFSSVQGATQYALEYKTNAIDWTPYTASAIDPENTFFNFENGINSNNSGLIYFKWKAYNNGQLLFEQDFPPIDAGYSTFPPLENAGWLYVDLFSQPYYDEFGDFIEGEFGYRYIGTAVATGYKISQEPESSDIFIEDDDTPESIMQRIANEWGYVYHPITNTVTFRYYVLPSAPSFVKV